MTEASKSPDYSYYYREKGEIMNLHHKNFDEHAFHMGYPTGYLSGFNWGVYDHYGLHAKTQKQGAHLQERNNCK